MKLARSTLLHPASAMKLIYRSVFLQAPPSGGPSGLIVGNRKFGILHIMQVRQRPVIRADILRRLAYATDYHRLVAWPQFLVVGVGWHCRLALISAYRFSIRSRPNRHCSSS
jgi:hypothetical protein